VYDAREKIITFAENVNADWILYIDSDMVLPNDSLLKFANARLENEALDIVGGMCFKRTPPFQPCFYTKARINPETKKPLLESPIDFPETGLIEVEGIGMACTFVRKNAWRKVKEKFDSSFFPFPGVGEDLSFCIRARMAGIKMYTDLSINVGHMSQVEIKKEHFFAARDEHMRNNPKEPLFREV
jgi:GT2 family glycosyltransferase